MGFARAVAALFRQCALNNPMRSSHFRRFAPAAIVLLLLEGTGRCAKHDKPTLISLDQAIDLALAHNHTIQATRTLILAEPGAGDHRQSSPQSDAGSGRPVHPDFQSRRIFPRMKLNEEPAVRHRARLSYSSAARSASAACKLPATRPPSLALRSRTLSGPWLSASASSSSACCWRNRRCNSRSRICRAFQQTVDIGEAQFKAGYIGEGDYLKIKLQLLQFQTDVSSARLAKVQALVGLRAVTGLQRSAGRFRRNRRSGLPAD